MTHPYQSKPVQAVQWFKDGDDPRVTDVMCIGYDPERYGGQYFETTALVYRAIYSGDWIITNALGQITVCSQKDFKLLFTELP